MDPDQTLCNDLKPDQTLCNDNWNRTPFVYNWIRIIPLVKMWIWIRPFVNNGIRITFFIKIRNRIRSLIKEWIWFRPFVNPNQNICKKKLIQNCPFVKMWNLFDVPGYRFAYFFGFVYLTNQKTNPETTHERIRIRLDPDPKHYIETIPDNYKKK